MARNSEKAMTTLARWRSVNIESKKEKEIRPYLATECDNLQKAEKFRRHIISEASKNVALIQNAGMGEYKLRDLNDNINKLLREKGHWEDQIKKLGGPDYKRVGPKMLDKEGAEVRGDRGYRYFGATRDLPGVRELFEQLPPAPVRKTRAALSRDLEADYYGYEAYVEVLPLEMDAEMTARKKLKEEIRERLGKDMETDEDDRQEPDDMKIDYGRGDSTACNMHVFVPAQTQIEEALVRRKKQELLDKFITPDNVA